MKAHDFLMLSGSFVLVLISSWALAADPAVSVGAATTQPATISVRSPSQSRISMFPGNGVRCSAVVSLPDKLVVRVDEDASRFISAVDSTGKVLNPAGGKWMSGFFSEISSDRHKVEIPLGLRTRPTAGASAVRLKGSIVLHCGSDEKTLTSEPAELAKETTIKFGPHSITMGPDKEQRKLNNDPKQQPLAIVADKMGQWMLKYDLLDSKGVVVKPQYGMRRFDEDNDSLTCHISLPSDMKTVALRITYYENLETVVCPIDVNIDLPAPGNEPERSGQ